MSTNDGPPDQNFQWPPLRDLIKKFDLTADKKFGQNFIFDQNITDKIVKQAGDLRNYNIIEIGPGPGGLTRSILESGAKAVYAFEIDPRAVNLLSYVKNIGGVNLNIIQGDALKADILNTVPAPRKIIANLPYNVATPLLLKFLEDMHSNPESYKTMTLMFQKEVADRITAQPSTKKYGRLSVISQWVTNPIACFDLPPSVFCPEPKVMSSVVTFSAKTRDENIDFEKMEKITASAFQHRRKMIRSSLKNYESTIRYLGLDPTVRAENLTVQDYINLLLEDRS